ncbi:hypothetical protein B7435_17105 [Mycolicibacterium peregrinum]|uniref:hypothetical protein n=1 Tax=Mycolicibacterium peregrinum TaxID=43304 RepID=UPI000B4A5F80|nr:hypothetical protein [Mycolicibacterium peregrinum]OWM01278.1 hypothetical protein B7435_17105 [Mycolicibacterium peregrinum]
MTQTRTLRFHTKYGPARLFDKAREQLKHLAGLSLAIPHARSRFDERGVPLQYLTDFQPERWELFTVETAVRTGRITYMSLRRRIEPTQYLWIVLAAEHVITAWVTESRSDRATNPLIVRDGPAWEAAAKGHEPAITGALAEWGDQYTRRVRALRVLDAVAALPERPSGQRLAHAATLVLRGRTWNEAAAEAGWSNRAGLDAAIMRLLRAVKRHGRGDDAH